MWQLNFVFVQFSFLESMAEDIGGVEAVLQEHLTFRRKKSSTIRARGETYTLNPNIQGSFTQHVIHWRGYIRPQLRAGGMVGGGRQTRHFPSHGISVIELCVRPPRQTYGTRKYCRLHSFVFLYFRHLAPKQKRGLSLRFVKNKKRYYCSFLHSKFFVHLTAYRKSLTLLYLSAGEYSRNDF